MTTERKPPPDHVWRFRRVESSVLVERFEKGGDPNRFFKKEEDNEIEYKEATRSDGGGQYNLF